MRTAALIMVLLGIGILATLSSRPLSIDSSSRTLQATPSSSRPLQRSDGPGSDSSAPSPLREGRGEGQARSSSRPLQSGNGLGSNLIARIPAQLPPPARLPATLELVTFPNLPGAPSSAPKTITRTEALASVIASQEFQETVTPLARLYFATFGRYPDYEGLNHYTGQREEARPLDAIATEFVGSREFQNLYGLLDNDEFVERMFVNILGHPAQGDVRGYWVSELDSGRMTRGQVLVDLSESGAFRERIANQVFVSTAYTEALRRTPDPLGFQHWVAQMRQGQSRDAVISGLLTGR